VDEPFARAVRGGDEMLERVNCFRREIARIEDADDVQARLDRQREIADDAAPDPVVSKRRLEIRESLGELRFLTGEVA